MANDVRILSFHYKITHRILACERNLKTWQMEKDNVCNICKNDIDGIEHYLIASPMLLHFWDHFFNWWKATSLMMFPVDTYNIRPKPKQRYNNTTLKLHDIACFVLYL